MQQNIEGWHHVGMKGFSISSRVMDSHCRLAKAILLAKELNKKIHTKNKKSRVSLNTSLFLSFNPKSNMYKSLGP